MKPVGSYSVAISSNDKAEYSHSVRALYDFGVHDEQGRRVGAICSFYTVDVKGERYLWSPKAQAYVAPGRYFIGCFEAARSGKQFGPVQRTRIFKTVAERDAALAKYLADAQKRAQKQFA